MKAKIVCIIDRSGSMESIRTDAIGGFNAFLQEQKDFPGEARLTLVLFNTDYRILHDNAPIANVRPLSMGAFMPIVGTALYDAVGKSINYAVAQLNDMPNEDKPDKVIVVILTDGQENASHEFSREKVAEMIKHQQDVYSWEFIFLAANQDAFAVGGALNIKAKNTANFLATGIGTREAYGKIDNLTKAYRA